MDNVGALISIFRGSIAQPARTPVNASTTPSRTRPHDSGPPWTGRDRNQARAPQDTVHWSRFLKPLYDPGRSDFPNPVLASALHGISQDGPSPTARNCGAGAPFAPTTWSLRHPFATTAGMSQIAQHCVWLRAIVVATECPEPLCPKRVLPAPERPQGRLEGHYPLVFAHTGSCARPSRSPRLRSPVVRLVFAGCHQSLLRDGPSRHYLRDPCVGARTPTPPRSPAARVRFFAKDTGLTPE